jgi:hypothetical protein
VVPIALPSHTLPRRAWPGHALACRASQKLLDIIVVKPIAIIGVVPIAMPCRAPPCHAEPGRAKPRLAMPCHAKPRLALPRQAKPRRVS